MSSGKYEGNETVLIVGDNAEPDRSIAQITDQQLQEMGFKTQLRLVTRDTMYTRFCNASESEVNVCPSVGWAQDFADPQTMLDPTFNGEHILKTGNSNWPELNVPAVNKAIDAAKLVTDPNERAQAWAKVNRDDRRPGPGDPLHVGLPVRGRLAERARRPERVLDDLGLELHLAEVTPPSHDHRPPARRIARRAGGRREPRPWPDTSSAASPGWCCCSSS